MDYIQVLGGYDPWLYPFVLHDSGLQYLATATYQGADFRKHQHSGFGMGLTWPG